MRDHSARYPPMSRTVRFSEKDHALLQGSFHPNPLKHGLRTCRYAEGMRTLSVYLKAGALFTS